MQDTRVVQRQPAALRVWGGDPMLPRIAEPGDARLNLPDGLILQGPGPARAGRGKGVGCLVEAPADGLPGELPPPGERSSQVGLEVSL